MSGVVGPMYNFEDCTAKMKHNLEAMSRLARELMLLSKQKNKQRLDTRATKRVFAVNERVLIRREPAEKLGPVYDGPYTIAEIRGSNAVLVDVANRFRAEARKDRLVAYEER